MDILINDLKINLSFNNYLLQIIIVVTKNEIGYLFITIEKKKIKFLLILQ